MIQRHEHLSQLPAPAQRRHRVARSGDGGGASDYFAAIQSRHIDAHFAGAGAGGDGGDRAEALRLKGPPAETRKLEAEIDATTLVYPASAQLQSNNTIARAVTGAGDRAGAMAGDQAADNQPAAKPDVAKTGKGGSGVRDRAAAPPEGAKRDTAGQFSFQFPSGLTGHSTPNKGDLITCSLLIDDQGRVFTLDGVSITFHSRVESETVETAANRW